MDKFPSRERSAALAAGARVSAIVVAHRANAALDLCLRSALAEPWIDELIVVDHANAADVSSTLRALMADRRDVKIVSTKTADGAPKLTSGALANMGAAHAHGRWLLFLDPDVVLKRGAVQRLAAAGGEARAPWIVGGRLTGTDGRERRAVRMGKLNTWSALAVATAMPGPKSRKVKNGARPGATKAAAVSGAFMLVQRSDFEDLGGFDTGYATDGADLDLCRRAAEAGGSVLYHPSASGVQFLRDRNGRRQAQGLALFAARSAKTPFERAFAAIARPAFEVLLALRAFVAGRPPVRRRRAR